MNLTQEQIDFLNKYTRGTWKETPDGIDIDGNFSCKYNENVEFLPVKFNNVTGDFNCYNCPLLTSLAGAPNYVGVVFNCAFCISLTSLEGAPNYVGENFHCYNCTSLISAKGLPKHIGGKIIYSGTPKEFETSLSKEMMRVSI